MRRALELIAAAMIVVAVSSVALQGWRVYRARQARRALFSELLPVKILNCDLQRFGEAHDGGYLACANLLSGVEAGYSYGIAGYDKWGCDISDRLQVSVHEYDCFDTRKPQCLTGRTVFHPECVGTRAAVIDGRQYDSVPAQLAKNGDASHRLVLKMDVEGAEWDALSYVPDSLLQNINQLTVEFHGVDDPKYAAVVRRLKQFFVIGHVHFNNSSCREDLAPFPAWAFEVLFVSKSLARTSEAANRPILSPLDAPNISWAPDCQPERW
jgi:hypothetical protein